MKTALSKSLFKKTVWLMDLLKKDSSTGVFLKIFRKFFIEFLILYSPFYRTHLGRPGLYFWQYISITARVFIFTWFLVVH